MTYELSAAARSLLTQPHLHRVLDIRGNFDIVPELPGIYGWWFATSLPGVPMARTLTLDDRRLLYVGIAPSGPPKPDRKKKARSLRDRLKNHCRGPIGSSTLRRTLACLLHKELGFELKRLPSGKLGMRKDDEKRLTDWMDTHIRVGWITSPTPWLLEHELINSGPRLPLNIQGSSDPFRKELKRLRARRTALPLP